MIRWILHFAVCILGLSAFLDANTERRELLLGQRSPRFDSSFDEAIAQVGDDFERVVLKAQAARDYFLLVGPPGTGKTSRALRRMVEHFLCNIIYADIVTSLYQPGCG